jgi:hypothetical protein
MVLVVVYPTSAQMSPKKTGAEAPVNYQDYVLKKNYLPEPCEPTNSG